MTYKNLMSPAAIGGIEFRNRILMAPMGSNLSREDGHCDERIQSYYPETSFCRA